MRERNNIIQLSDPKKSELIKAILNIKASGKYNQYVLRHAQAPMKYIHRCPAFLPWHRQFLLDFENDLQEASGNSNLALPYWNWAEDAAWDNPKDAPIWQDDLMGGDGDGNGIVKTGPFREGQWVIVNKNGSDAGPLLREFGKGAPTLASQSDVDNALNTTPYDAYPWNAKSNPSFRNRLEGWYGDKTPGLHNRTHVWVGGSMAPMTSPNDPVFFMHHCFVDKLWADWQVKYPNEQYQPQDGNHPKQTYNELMVEGVYKADTPANMNDIKELGYKYRNS